MKKRRVMAAISVAGGYIIVYLAGRVIWCDWSESSFIGWLVWSTPSGQSSYLYGWLLSSNLFWISAVISAVPSLWGKYRFSAITFTGFVVGLLSGMIFGPYPKGIPYGHGDYGWLIWGIIYLFSAVIGIILEYLLKRKNNKDNLTI